MGERKKLGQDLKGRIQNEKLWRKVKSFLNCQGKNETQIPKGNREKSVVKPVFTMLTNVKCWT